MRHACRRHLPSANELVAIVERGGSPLQREALRRMQDRDPGVRRRALRRHRHRAGPIAARKRGIEAGLTVRLISR